MVAVHDVVRPRTLAHVPRQDGIERDGKAARQVLGLTLADVLLITVLFTLGGQALSLLLFKIRLRDHPY